MEAHMMRQIKQRTLDLQDFKSKNPGKLDMIRLYLPKGFINQASVKHFNEQQNNMSCLISKYYDYVSFNDDIFGNEYKIIDNILMAIEENHNSDNPLFKIKIDYEALVFNFKIANIKIAFDFPDYAFFFNINPFCSPLKFRDFGQGSIYYHSKNYESEQKRSFAKIYDLTRKLKNEGIQIEHNIIRFEFLMSGELLEGFDIKDLDVKFDSFKKKAKPVLVDETKKLLNHETFFISQPVTFRTLHPYLYDIMDQAGCGSSKASEYSASFDGLK